MANQRVLQWLTMNRTWWLYDAQYQCPFKSGYLIVKYLQGKHKPIYHPISDVGDHVVVINCKRIVMREEYWRTFTYSHHTRYPGGFSRTSAWRLHNLEPTKVMEKAVYSRLAGNLLRKTFMRRLHLYPGEDVPDEIFDNITDQIRQVQTVPRRFDQYTEEEIKEFPALFDWPQDHIMIPPKKKKKKVLDTNTETT